MSVATSQTMASCESGTSAELTLIADNDLVKSDALKVLLTNPSAVQGTDPVPLLEEVSVERIHVLYDMGVGLLARLHSMQKVFTDYERHGAIPLNVHKDNKHANQAAVLYDFPFIIKASQFSEISDIVLKHYPAVVSSFASINRRHDELIDNFNDEILNKLDTTIQLYMDIVDFKKEAASILISLPKLIGSWNLDTNKALTVLYLELLMVFVKVVLLLSQNNDDNRVMVGLYYAASSAKRRKEAEKSAPVVAALSQKKADKAEFKSKKTKGSKDTEGRVDEKRAATALPDKPAKEAQADPYLEYRDRVLYLVHCAADPKAYLLRTFNSLATPTGGLLPILLQLRDPLQLLNDIEHMRSMSILSVAAGDSSFAQLPLPVLKRGHKDNSSDERTLDQEYAKYPCREGVNTYYELAHGPKYTDYVVFALYAVPFLLFDSDALSLYRLVCTRRLFVTIYRDFSLSIHKEFQTYLADYTSLDAQRKLDVLSSIPIDTRVAETLEQIAKSATLQAGLVMRHRRSFIHDVLRRLRLVLVADIGLLAPKCPLVVAALSLARQDICDYFMHSYSDSEYREFAPPQKVSRDSVNSDITISKPAVFLVADYMNLRQDVAEYYKVDDYRSEVIMTLIFEADSLVALINEHWQTIIKPYYVEYITFGDIRHLRPIIDNISTAYSSSGDKSSCDDKRSAACSSVAALVKTIDAHLQGVSDAYYYHKLSNRGNRDDILVRKRASVTGLTAATIDIQSDLMLIRLAWDNACLLICQNDMLGSERTAALQGERAVSEGEGDEDKEILDINQSAAAASMPLMQLTRRMTDIVERVYYVDSLDFLVQALCDPCECVFYSERLQQAAAESLSPRSVVFGRHRVDGAAGASGASVSTSRTGHSTHDTTIDGTSSAMHEFGMILDTSHSFLGVFAMLNGVMRCVHRDHPKETFSLQAFVAEQVGVYFDIFIRHFVDSFEAYWVSLQALDNQTCSVEAARRLCRLIKAKKDAAASGAGGRVEAEQLPGAESESWARPSILDLVELRLKLTGMLQGALENRALVVNRKTYDVLAILQDKLTKYMFVQFHRLYAERKIANDATSTSLDLDMASLSQCFHRGSVALRKITVGIQAALSLFGDSCVRGDGDSGFMDAIRVLLFRELVDTETLGPCGTAIGMVDRQTVNSSNSLENCSLIWKIADNFLYVIKMLEDPLNETTFVISDSSFRSKNSKAADDDSRSSLSLLNPSRTSTLLDTYINAAELTALCQLIGPQGVRAVTLKIYSHIKQHLAVVFNFLEVNEKVLEAIRANAAFLASVDIVKLKADLRDLELFMGALVSIGTSLAVREALLKALREVSSARSAPLMQSLLTTTVIVDPFDMDINTVMHTANLVTDLGLRLKHDSALLSSLDEVVCSGDEEENRRYLHLFPCACAVIFLSDRWQTAVYDISSDTFSANEHCIIVSVSKLIYALYGYARSGKAEEANDESYSYNQRRQHHASSAGSSEYNHSRDDYRKCVEEYVRTSSLLLLLYYHRVLDTNKKRNTDASPPVKAMIVLLEEFVKENSHSVSRQALEAVLPYGLVHASALDLSLGSRRPGEAPKSFSDLGDDSAEADDTKQHRDSED